MTSVSMKHLATSLGLAFVVAALALAQSWDVPETDKARVNPVASSPEALEEGKEHFQKQCVMCHGESLKGNGPGASMFAVEIPDLSGPEARARLTDGEIFYKMTVGKNPMPSMESKLTEEERWKVVLYFRSLQTLN